MHYNLWKQGFAALISVILISLLFTTVVFTTNIIVADTAATITHTELVESIQNDQKSCAHIILMFEENLLPNSPIVLPDSTSCNDH